jgi:hypothetical protein
MKEKKKNYVLAIIGVITFCIRLTAQMPVENESHHKVVFDNQQIRVIDLVVPVADTTLRHTHSAASVVLFLSKSNLAIQNTGQPAAVTNVKSGDVVYRSYDEKPVEHIVWCEDKSVFRCLVVEMKNHSSHNDCGTLQLSNTEQLWQQKLVNAYRVDFNKEKTIRLPKSSCSFLLISYEGSVNAVVSGKKSTLKEGEFVSIPMDNQSEFSSDHAKAILLQLNLNIKE